MKLAYNSFGQVITEQQEHGGAVNDANTPKVQYTYQCGQNNVGGNRHSRPTRTTYPSGRLVDYTYNVGIDDTLDRVSRLATSASQFLASYYYLGLGTIVQTRQPRESGLRCDLAFVDTNGRSDPYTSLDRFGRIIDLRWMNGNDLIERAQHGYDRAGNRLWRKCPVASDYGYSIDEYYTYNTTHQLAALERGGLNGQCTGINPGARNFYQTWRVDTLGNWKNYVRYNNGSTLALSQYRDHNGANEITAIDATTGPKWLAPTHDRNGNMTAMPIPGNEAIKQNAVYDAWNRLVRVTDANNVTLAEYQYDARNFRIAKLIPNGTRTDYYHSSQNQVLEEYVSNSSTIHYPLPTVHYQYTWGLRYIDDLICRESGSERLHFLQDANWNVIAIVNGGAVVQRYTYDAYGQPTGSYSNNTYLFSGRELDTATGLYYFRARYYHPSLGRFITRDPIGYEADDFNLYRYVRNNPLIYTDPLGLKPTKASGAKELQDAADKMKALCNDDNCVCKEKEKAHCESEADAIVNALVQVWNDNFGNGKSTNPAEVGGYLCHDWARMFYKAVTGSVKSKIWSGTFRYFTSTWHESHWAVMLSINKSSG